MSEFPKYGQLNRADYERMGLKAGLEVHQQLATRTKLFCRCPAGKYSSDYDAEILRHMRPTLSELGEYDRTALMEFKTKKEIVYRLNRETVCTYEMDDTPPFLLNQEALDIAIELAILLDLNLVGELHIIRKQYLDGSIPTGFQRTTVVGVSGAIPYGERRIGIQQLGLEEDSCREVSDIGHVRTFMTDRLSIPLIEVVTLPQLHTPGEVAEVAQIIRRLTRSTGKVRTGAGSARQDVNVSVTGGTRVEIKGVPRIAWIPQLVHYEALRQQALLSIASRLRGRKLRLDEWKPDHTDVTRLTRRFASGPVASLMALGARAAVVKLPGMRGVLDHPTAPGRTLGAEVADRVRIIACLDHSPNILWPSMGGDLLRSHLWARLRVSVDAGERDELVLVYGPESDVQTGVGEIIARCREAFQGVPAETRQAQPDGTTRFERLLPGPDRMYPDTDLPPIAIREERIKRISSEMNEGFWSAVNRYRSEGVSAEMAWPLAVAPVERRRLYDLLMEVEGCSGSLAAAVAWQWSEAMTRRGVPLGGLDSGLVRQVVVACVSGRITRDVIPQVLQILAEQEVAGGAAELDDALRALGLEGAGPSDDEAQRWVSWMVQRAADQAGQNGWTSAKESLHRYLMGSVMVGGEGGDGMAADPGEAQADGSGLPSWQRQGLRGRVPGSRVSRWVAEALDGLDGAARA